jgi:hypothetical protein
MAETILIQSKNPTSGRIAVLEDDTTVAWLYLCDSEHQQPEKDAIVYMRIPPPEHVHWGELAKAGHAPYPSQEFATSTAVIANPKADEFSFLWSSNGQAVAILYQNNPIAFAAVSEQRGYSKAIAKACPLANAWSEAVYNSLFS